jgi:hypothetical protein
LIENGSLLLYSVVRGGAHETLYPACMNFSFLPKSPMRFSTNMEGGRGQAAAFGGCVVAGHGKPYFPQSVLGLSGGVSVSWHENEAREDNMKRSVSIFLCSILCLILNTWAADRLVDLSGTWILDVQKSDPFLHPIRNLGAPSMGGSEGNLDAGDRRGGTPSSRDMSAGMPGRSMGGGFPGMGRGPQQSGQNPPMIIEQNEAELRISRTGLIMGKQTPVFENYTVDGTEHAQIAQIPGSPDPVKVVVIAKAKKNGVQVRITTYGPKSKGQMKREIMLSKDGKTLTLKSTNATPTGDLIQDQVYHKKE